MDNVDKMVGIDELDAASVTSSKRMGIRTTASNHTVNIYRNSTYHVSIESAPLGRFMDKARINVDYLPIIFIYRCFMLLESLLKGSLTISYKYNIDPAQMSGHDSTVMEPMDEESQGDVTNALTTIVPNSVRHAIMEVLPSLSNDADEEEYINLPTSVSTGVIDEVRAEMGISDTKEVEVVASKVTVQETAGLMAAQALRNKIKVRLSGRITQHIRDWKSTSGFKTHMSLAFPQADVTMLNQRFKANRTMRYLLNTYHGETLAAFITAAIATFALSKSPMNDDLVTWKQKDM